MDLTNADLPALARQLRKPEGDAAGPVAEMMKKRTAAMNAFAVALLGVRPEDRVLEIGFGPGESVAEFVRLTPKGFVAGIDHSEEMVRMAEDRNRRAVAEEHVELALGTADAMPYADGSFDKVFSVNVFHFWKDPSRELAECLRVLAPGGRALFYVTHPSSWIPGMAGTGVFVAREPADMEALLRAAGFRDVKTDWFAYEGGKGFAASGTKRPA